MDPIRVEFDTGLDDLVDVNLRLLRGTRWGRRQRTRSISSAVIAFIVSMFVVAASVGDIRSAGALLLLAGICAGAGVPFGLLYRAWYDSVYRRRIRAYLQEQLGGRQTWICEIELRPDGAWSRGNGLEVIFPWSETTGVDDEIDGVLLRFRGGGIFARNRAFSTPEERTRFIDFARAAPPIRSN